MLIADEYTEAQEVVRKSTKGQYMQNLTGNKISRFNNRISTGLFKSLRSTMQKGTGFSLTVYFSV